MKIKKLLPAVAVVVVVPLVSFWAASARSTTPYTPSDRDGRPARLEPVPGTDMQRVVLSERAAERIGVVTKPVGALDGSRASESAGGRPLSASSEDGGRRTVIPYSAVLYDAHGDTWVYTQPETLVFVRQRVSIESIDSHNAVLSDGPPPGTMVVTVGGAELFGAELFGPEFEVGQ